MNWLVHYPEQLAAAPAKFAAGREITGELRSPPAPDRALLCSWDMSRSMKFLAAVSLASLMNACSSAAAPSPASVVPGAEPAPPAASEDRACDVVVAVACQSERTWDEAQVRDLVADALSDRVSPWQPTLESPLLPDFAGESVVVAVYTLGETGEQADEFVAMKGYGVRVDLRTRDTLVADWGVPTGGSPKRGGVRY